MKKQTLWQGLTDWEQSPVLNLSKRIRIQMCIRKLKGKHSQARWEAVTALGNIAYTNPRNTIIKEAVPALVDALNDKDSGVRWKAAWVLVSIGIEHLRTVNVIVPALIYALNDEDSCLRGHVIEGLGNILEKCQTLDQLMEFEKALDEGFHSMRKRSQDRHEMNEAMSGIGKLITSLAKRRNELVEDKGILLSDIPKPPKSGTIYRTLDSRLETTSRSVTERVRNG